MIGDNVDEREHRYNKYRLRISVKINKFLTHRALFLIFEFSTELFMIEGAFHLMLFSQDSSLIG